MRLKAPVLLEGSKRLSGEGAAVPMADSKQQVAQHISGTREEDLGTCPFYLRIGSCRHGDQCSRMHNRPKRSTALIIVHLYINLPEGLTIASEEPWDDAMYESAQDHLEAFYEEVFLTLSEYGEIEDLIVVDNVSEHMLGNVYVKYFSEDGAEAALHGLSGRFYGDKMIHVEYTPVTDFKYASCRAFQEARCDRGGYCNFMHVKHVPKSTKRKLVRQMYDDHPDYGGWKRARRERGDPHDLVGLPSIEDIKMPTNKPKEIKDKKPTISEEERKAMIARWNDERRKGNLGIPTT